ncbi:solute carrier family 66 member 2 isoform X2 [Nilaparvata lugens]|uniref:solute carrier family 66 member 2 isoform X2 n=1 Tax=Nilaparvata lugens TaxID=108931 RepID=UPI000B99B124|nr:solute carrier family 66 member 2 isoform X2 [Nilaparvata lugens]
MNSAFNKNNSISIIAIDNNNAIEQNFLNYQQRTQVDRYYSAWQAVVSTRQHLVEIVMDYVIKEIQEVTFTKLVKWTCSTLMIFGGVVPFIPQYREIKNKKDAEGFSLYVCLVLIFANTLRILFWFGKRYELPLLIQSFIMNIAMLLMIHLCVSVKRKMHLAHFQEHTFTDFDWKYFWAWTDFQSYLDFLIVMIVCCSLLTFLLIKSTIFVETLGLVALLSEAMLAVPQLVKNFQYKSTVGMSVLMVLMWMVGDVFKTTYFVLREAPAQFWICGGLQVFIDILILYQVYLYRDSLNINLPHAGRID